MPQVCAFALMLLSATVLAIPGHAAGPLKINTSIKPPFSTAELDGYFDMLIMELFTRNRIAVELVRLPPERALRYANEGVSDGEVPRIAGLSKAYPHIIQVPVKLIDYHFVAFSQPRPLPDITFEALEKFRVGMLIGWKIYENNVPAGTRQNRLTGPLQLFLMLNSNRIDVGLYEKYAGHYLIQSNGFNNIYECQPPLAVKPMFLYLNQKHAALVPLLADTLESMNTDGTRQAIRQKTLGRFDPREHGGSRQQRVVSE